MLTVLFREIFPSKYARSDPEAVWLRLVKAVTASVQPESGRIVYAGPDFPHPIRFRSSKEGPDHIVQSEWLDRLWPNAKIWSGSKPVCRNHRGRFVAGRNRPTTSFPLSDSAAFVLSSRGVARSPPLCWVHDRYTPPTLRAVCKIHYNLSAGCMTDPIQYIQPLSRLHDRYIRPTLRAVCRIQYTLVHKEIRISRTVLYL